MNPDLIYRWKLIGEKREWSQGDNTLARKVDAQNPPAFLGRIKRIVLEPLNDKFVELVCDIPDNHTPVCCKKTHIHTEVDRNTCNRSFSKVVEDKYYMIGSNDPSTGHRKYRKVNLQTTEITECEDDDGQTLPVAGADSKK